MVGGKMTEREVPRRADPRKYECMDGALGYGGVPSGKGAREVVTGESWTW